MDPLQQLFGEAGDLANQGQYAQAGEHLLRALQIAPNQADKLDPRRRKLAYLAATYFVKSGDFGPATELFLSLGERAKAAECLEKSGDMLNAQKVREGRLGRIESLSRRNASVVGGQALTKYTAERFEREGKMDLAIQSYVQLRLYGDAARLLRKEGQIGEAASMFAEAGRAYDAAICFLEMGDTGKGLDNLIRVPRDHRHYRAAAIRAIGLAGELRVMSFQLDNFLAEFIRTAPQDAREIEALYQLATLYEQNDFLENAKEVLMRVSAAHPDYRDVSSRLEKVNRFSAPSAAVYDRIRGQEAGYRGEQRRIDPGAILTRGGTVSLPDLPDLPDLPGLTMAPAVSQTAPVAVPTQAPEESSGCFEVGGVIADRYLVRAEIGRGGMAVVYQAEDRELEEEIALKVFLSQILDPAVLKESENRFKQELKLSRKLAHRNIIQLYDIGIHSGHRYISMELLQGEDLEHRLERHGGPYPFAEGIHLMIQACAGLNAAHEQGVVHRDIKPENLFVTDDGVLKVMDFGIAKNTVQPGVTVEGMLAGTPHYIAPEQISGFSKVNHLADLYSLGVAMYRMFTGVLPFDNDDMTRLLMMHISDAPRPPRELNSAIPAELEYIVLRLMEKNPTARFADARQTASYLKEAYKRMNG